MDPLEATVTRPLADLSNAELLDVVAGTASPALRRLAGEQLFVNGHDANIDEIIHAEAHVITEHLQ